MKTKTRKLVIGLVLAAIPASVFATETGTMSCNGGIVSIGDSVGEVISKCGQPASTTQREQKKVAESKKNYERTITSITIDDWIFNFGPDKFQYQLLLENGRVARIESLSYGY